MKLRLGVVPYLNALPLYWTLRDQCEITKAVPSQLAKQLESGAVDVALLPIADFLRGAGEGIVGDAIIGATREVRSVLLFHRKPISQIQSIALDSSSHTSVNLLRVLCADFWKIWPRFEDRAPDLEAMLSNCDAALLIGDPALQAARKSGDWQILDLASAWHEFTGKSFVFAAWIAREGLENRENLADFLNSARDEGRSLIPQIAAQSHENLPIETVESYLTQAIEFQMSPTHAAGLADFGARFRHHSGFLTYPGWKKEVSRFPGTRLETIEWDSDAFANPGGEENFVVKRGFKRDFKNALHFLIYCTKDFELERPPQMMATSAFWDIFANYASGLRDVPLRESRPHLIAAWQIGAEWDIVAVLAEGEEEFFFAEWLTTA